MEKPSDEVHKTKIVLQRLKILWLRSIYSNKIRNDKG